MAGINQTAGEILAEGFDLGHQAFDVQPGTGTLEQKDSGIVDGDKADAPTLDGGHDPASEGMNLEVGALNAIADGVIDVLGGLFEGFAGGGKPPPTPEQQKTANEREAKGIALGERLKRYEEEYKKGQECEPDQGLSLILDRDRERK
jgi:hypothetical protein